jgi:hypothetical protein
VAASKIRTSDPDVDVARCLYCPNPLDESTTFAHIVPECLGGRIGSRETCCSACNNFFGALESCLCEVLRPTSASVGARTGDGRPVMHRREIDGARYDFWNGGGRRLIDPPTFDKGTRCLVFPLPAGDSEQARLFAQQLWTQGLTPTALEDGTFSVVPQDDPVPANLGLRSLENVFTVADREHCRIFVKMALELLARYDGLAARSRALGDARRFARDDVGNLRFKADTASEGTGLLSKVTSRFQIGHSIEVWTNRRLVLTRIAFFQKLSFTACLAFSWQGPPFSIAHVLDPQEPTSALIRKRKRDGKRLSLWNESVSREAIAAFESHIANVANAKAASAAKTPIERAPMPVLDVGMRERIKVEYDQIVSQRGAREPRRRKQT